MSEIITIKSKELQEIFLAIDAVKAELDNLSKRTSLNDEYYLTDRELSTRLHVSRRTTQEWRNNGLIEYIQLDGKIIYPESSIQTFLNRNYQQAWGYLDGDSAA